nr:MAG TPA: hypothetical protein [Caudoviricetes sp.]
MPRLTVVIKADDLQRPRQHIRACTTLQFRQFRAWLY